MWKSFSNYDVDWRSAAVPSPGSCPSPHRSPLTALWWIRNCHPGRLSLVYKSAIPHLSPGLIIWPTLLQTTPHPPTARHAIQDNTIHYNSFFFFSLPPNLSLSPSLSPSYIPGLNTVNTFNALIYVLCSPISQGLGRCLLLSTSTPENWLGFIQTSQWERDGGSDLTCILLFEQ